MAALAGVALLACSRGSRPAPQAGDSTGPPPYLGGVRVMVFPVQAVQGLPGQPDAELAFALESRGEAVAWILPDELRAALGRSPAFQVTLTGLPVGMFLAGEVQRVGDPIFGNVRRLGALMDGQAALIPILARYRPGADGAPGVAEVAATLLDVRSGRVLWFGIVEGTPGAPEDPGVLASVADALARALVPGSTG